MNRKGKINGAEFEGVRIIVQKGKKLVYTEDVKKLSKVNEFKELVKNAELEHRKTPAALVAETLGDITVSTDLEHSVLRNSIENLESFIDECVAEIEANSVTIDREKIREFRGITKTSDHNLDNGGLKAQEEYFRQLAANEPNVLKKKLYEEMAEVCLLKADEIRLRRNEQPESDIVQSMVEEETQRNDLTRFERFKRWTKKNLGSISVVAISVAGIITTIVMGTRNVIKKGARATSKFAKTLAKIGEKTAPVIGGLLNLAAKLLSLGADAVGFLSINLWLLAVAIAYMLCGGGGQLTAGYKKTSFLPEEIRGRRECLVSPLQKSGAIPGDIYYVDMPKLNSSQCIIPDTMVLSFKFENSNTKSWFLNNL